MQITKSKFDQKDEIYSTRKLNLDRSNPDLTNLNN